MPESEKDYDQAKSEMLVIPAGQMQAAVAALQGLTVLTTGQSTGTSCHKQGQGWGCGDRDSDAT